MSLKDKAQAALARLSVAGGAPYPLDVEEAGRRVLCELTALDSLACAFDFLSLSTSALANATIAELKRLADALAARLTYLLEPIGPVEWDAEQCVVQLRSKPPQREDDRSTYYELLVRRGGELTLRRYTKEFGDARRPVPAHVTREVLFRLIDDFAQGAP